MQMTLDGGGSGRGRVERRGRGGWRGGAAEGGEGVGCEAGCGLVLDADDAGFIGELDGEDEEAGGFFSLVG